MSITADYHLHSSFSGDSHTPMEEMVLKGISLGLNSMCFTEHMDLDYVYSNPEDEGIFELTLLGAKKNMRKRSGSSSAWSWASSLI